MKRRIHGKRYAFEIFGKDRAHDDRFYIRAICKRSSRFSHINNLNAVLSELEVNSDDPTFQDSTWEVRGNDARRFAEIAGDILSDSKFVDYLESQLDIDRGEGEWEATI